jgi:hypothetical protein
LHSSDNAFNDFGRQHRQIKIGEKHTMTPTQVKDRAPGSSVDVARTTFETTFERERPATRQPQSIHHFHAIQKDNRYADAA